MNEDKSPPIIYAIVIYSILGFLMFMAFYLTGKEFKLETYQFFYIGAAALIWGAGFMICGGKHIRPKWKQSGKLISYLIFTTILLIWVGHYAVIFIIGHQMIGWVFYYKICKEHGIDWKTCEPADKYLALMEKWGRGDFK